MFGTYGHFSSNVFIGQYDFRNENLTAVLCTHMLHEVAFFIVFMRSVWYH